MSKLVLHHRKRSRLHRESFVCKKYNQLEIISTAIRYKPSGRSESIAITKCDCGVESITRLNRVISGVSSSCGCKKYLHKGSKPKHGHARKGHKSKIYQSYCDAKSRCENPKDTAFKDYGKVGRKICHCINTFEKFLHACDTLIGHPKEGETLDRIDNDFHYCICGNLGKDGECNLRWASRSKQIENRVLKNKTGFRGISINSCGNYSVQAYEISNKKYIYLGSFKVLSDAFEIAYDWYKENRDDIPKEYIEYKKGVK